MNAARLVRLSLRTLVRYPLRSTLVMLGTLVGVAALVLVVWAGATVQQRVLETIRRNFSPSSIVVTTGGPVLVGGPRNEGARLTLDDAAAAGALPAIETWDPILSLESVQVKRGEASATARVVAGSERAPRVWERAVTEGEYFDAAQVGASARVALLGRSTARELFGDEDPLGAEIQVGSVSFRVIGLLEPIGSDAHGNDRDAELVVPITTAMRRLANVDAIGGVRLVVRDQARVEAIAGEVRALLRERHALPADRADDFTVVTPVAIQAMLSRTQGILLVLLPLVAAVALLAGAAVAASVMLLSVTERTAEFGLRRALGARPGDVVRQLLVETAVTTAAGGLLGAGLGILGIVAVSRSFRMALAIPWGAVLLGLALSALVGLAAGVLPARRAGRLEPVQALRS